MIEKHTAHVQQSIIKSSNLGVAISEVSQGYGFISKRLYHIS